MQTIDISPSVKAEVVANRKFESTQQRPRELFKNGYISKVNIRRLLCRSKQTIHNWENLLLSVLPDYSLFRTERQPLTHYHYWCLEKLSKYQTKQEPYKPEGDLISYIERNIKSFSLESYINKFGDIK